jgi:diacylglycerol kinase family enzyme
MNSTNPALKHASPPTAQSSGLIILNPVAGEGNPDHIKEVIQSCFSQGSYDLYETTGEESLQQVVKTAVQEEDYGWVAAVGGDGTVSEAASGLAGTKIPLLVIPAGTGNALAQELGIPQEPEAACQLLEKGQIRILDGMQVDDRHYFLQLGIGLESVTMQNTPSEQKNRWGVLAYLWTAAKEAIGWHPHHFTLTVDGQPHNRKASELVIANTRHIGVFGLEWQGIISPDDGRLDIVLVRAKSLLDYVRTVWALFKGNQQDSDLIQFFTAYEMVQVESKRPLPIHGDGEILAEKTMIKATVNPSILSVIVPENLSNLEEIDKPKRGEK